MVLTHFSARYRNELKPKELDESEEQKETDEIDLNMFVEEAKETFEGGVCAARDYASIELNKNGFVHVLDNVPIS